MIDDSKSPLDINEDGMFCKYRSLGSIYSNNLNIILDMNARAKFVRGPAAETHIISLLGFLRLKKLTGTGFAYPNIMGELLKMRRSGKMIVPNISIWTNGFRDNLPICLAVGSPNLLATNPCDTSCRMIAMSIGSVIIDIFWISPSIF
jgi:hypothetical protein